MKIEEIESFVELGLAKLRSPEYKFLDTLLKPLLPKGYRARVSLVDKTGRKKRKNASAESWSPDQGEVRIYFERDTAEPPNELEEKRELRAKSQAEQKQSPSGPMSDLVRALDRAESRPGYQFVALKWFRDVALPTQGFDWAQSDSVRQRILREAIERRLILTSKVPNPKSPQFPVTAIRLNRLLPDTQAILGESAWCTDFAPVEIRGERLSETILRERR